MGEAQKTIPVDRVRAYTHALLEAAGAAPSHAELTAECLVFASLRGVDSHGLQLLTFYLDQLSDGRVDGKGRGRVLSESGACLHFDGENALGQVVSAQCADAAARLAREHGLGLAVARESNHFGAAAFWGQRIARQGMIAVVLCNASPAVAPWQAREARWGTNPICCAVPPPEGSGADEAVWLLDMATTTVAMGKIYKARLNQEPTIPPGWAMDSEGRPTMSTAAALAGFLMPLGGYKGSGLGMMVELLTGALSGGAISTELGGLRWKDRRFRVSQFFLAIDPARFGSRKEFTERVAHLAGQVKSALAASGYDEVLVAGDPEWRTRKQRLAHGIPMTSGLWNELAQHARRLGVAVPE
ncbi:MAG: Ldh family oxidoreductase [Bryobacterales bacterium]|nr:Ldh family oxidoreductase [Bryobacterales bacterium]